MIMGYADMVIWDACTAMAIWHASMPSVLVSTHRTETYQPSSKTQSGAGAYQPLDDPQHLKPACRHYENGRAKICAHLRVSVCARLHCTPRHRKIFLSTWGGTHGESAAQMPGAHGMCSWAGRAGSVAQMRATKHAGVQGGYTWKGQQLGA